MENSLSVNLDGLDMKDTICVVSYPSSTGVSTNLCMSAECAVAFVKNNPHLPMQISPINYYGKVISLD